MVDMNESSQYSARSSVLESYFRGKDVFLVVKVKFVVFKGTSLFPEIRSYECHAQVMRKSRQEQRHLTSPHCPWGVVFSRKDF